MIHTKPRYTVADCLVLLSMSRGRFYEDVNNGKLKTYKIGKRRYIDPKDIDEYVERCRKDSLAA